MQQINLVSDNMAASAKDDPRVMTLLGETYYRSDLAADMLDMHKNTLLHKAKAGKIRRYCHKRTVWFKQSWLKEYLERESMA